MVYCQTGKNGTDEALKISKIIPASTVTLPLPGDTSTGSRLDLWKYIPRYSKAGRLHSCILLKISFSETSLKNWLSDRIFLFLLRIELILWITNSNAKKNQDSMFREKGGMNICLALICHTQVHSLGSGSSTAVILNGGLWWGGGFKLRRWNWQCLDRLFIVPGGEC